MRKKVLMVLLILSLIATYIYLRNDGFYVLQNMNKTQIELINKYTIEFPQTIIVENFILENDIDSYWFSHNQYIEATILVPNGAIDTLFPEELREYDIKNILDLSKDDNEKISFGVWMPRTVVKWLDKTQRTINFTVMQSGEEYTKVYLLVDKLGWNVYSRLI